MSDQEITLRGRLNSQQRNRLYRLLNMMYTPRELAQEVGFNQRQVYRVYIPAGCPHERDENNRLWINGAAFAGWVKEIYRKRELTKDETFCLTCRQPVELIDPVRKQEGGLVYFISYCPKCGRKLSRIVGMKKRRR